MTLFSNIRKISLNTFQKAYVEGVYNDSTLNRKLGRVGMTYTAYAEKVKKDKEKNKVEKKEKVVREFPETLSDLEFSDNKAKYNIKDNTIEVKQSLNNVGRKNFSISVFDNKGDLLEDFYNLDTDQMSKRLKLLNRKYSNNLSKSMSKDFFEKTSLTPEELDKKWGKWWGFTFTYHKNDLDIKVIVSEKSTKDNILYNIYVVDTETNKKKSYLNLSKEDTHKKLLLYDLNSKIDANNQNLSDSEKLEFYKEYNSEINSNESPILSSMEFDYNSKERQFKTYEKDNLKLIIVLDNNKYNVVLKNKDNKESLSFSNIDYNKLNEALKSNFSFLNLKEKLESKDKELSSYLDNKFLYYSNKKGGFNEYKKISDKEFVEKVFNKDGNLESIDIVNNISKNEKRLPSIPISIKRGELEPKNIVKSYHNYEDLLEIPGITDFESTNISKYEDFFKEKNIFGQGRKKAIAWSKEGKLRDWLIKLPNSNKMSKQQIYDDIRKDSQNNKSQLFSVKDVSDFKKNILKKYY